MKYPYNNLENFTLPKLLESSTTLYRDNPLFAKVGENPSSYNDFYNDVICMVNLLKENGISQGDKVILLSENMPNWATAYFSVTYFGGVIVPILPDFHPSDVHHIIKHSDAKAVFVSQRHLNTIEECNEKDINFVINLDTLSIVEELTNTSYFSKIKQKSKEIADKISHSNKDTDDVGEDNLAAIIYTSGTTGHSKGVMLSHKNLVTNAMSLHETIKVLPSDSFLSILPLAHTFECTVGMIVPILNGSSVYYIDKVPTPSVLIKAFAMVKPTMILMVPLIIEKIYKSKILTKLNASFVTRNLFQIPFFKKQISKIAGKKLMETFGGRVRYIGIGGVALATYVEKFLIDANFPYLIGYGLTETSPLIAATSMNSTPKINSTGSTLTGVEVYIKDKDPKTGEGEILVKSPSVMMGYYKDKEKSDEVMEDGWFLTGDLGYMDKDGNLFISGRSKNVIIGASGENIYPEQLESIINHDVVVLDSLVMEKDGKLIARIHLDYEIIDTMFHAETSTDKKVKEEIDNLLEKMRTEFNTNVSSFSRINKFVEQIDPFVKTPTKKIKRYLYEN
ncbi:AMP-binding protein [Sulfurimonas sp.]|nr:AMP-binding protein [Sulfurimonas sp.]